MKLQIILPECQQALVLLPANPSLVRDSAASGCFAPAKPDHHWRAAAAPRLVTVPTPHTSRRPIPNPLNTPTFWLRPLSNLAPALHRVEIVGVVRTTPAAPRLEASWQRFIGLAWAIRDVAESGWDVTERVESVIRPVTRVLLLQRCLWRWQLQMSTSRATYWQSYLQMWRFIGCSIAAVEKRLCLHIFSATLRINRIEEKCYRWQCWKKYNDNEECIPE